MTTPAITFDRLAYIDRLKDSVVTKADFEELAGELRMEMANLKVDILRWLVVTQIALGGVILAAVKFVR